MRLSISGTHNSGKSTLISHFLAKWSKYETPKTTYRDELISKNLSHSDKTTPETQKIILDFMVDQFKYYDSSSLVVFDRCPLDNLVYTLWAHEKDMPGFDHDYVTEAIATCRESMRKLDIIFWTKYNPELQPVDDGVRNTDVNTILEVENIFTAIYQELKHNPEGDVFFPARDSPVIIELPHDLDERISLIGEYVSAIDGDLVDDGSILEPSKLEEMEKLLKQQQFAFEQEKKEKEMFAKLAIRV